jgi:hypothetical protein
VQFDNADSFDEISHQHPEHAGDPSVMKTAPGFAICLSLVFAVSTYAATYRVETLDEAPPKDDLPSGIAEQLDEKGIRVFRGTDTGFCDIWLCKTVETAEDASSDDRIKYPFEQGQLIGALRYLRDGADLRDQEMAEGTYTLRYALQPVDGAHEGTFPTRDFFLLVRAADEESADPIDDEEELNYLAMDAAESAHPAMLALLQVEGDAEKLPAIRHDEEHDWWIVRQRVAVQSGDKARELDMEYVLVGVVEE